MKYITEILLDSSDAVNSLLSRMPIDIQDQIGASAGIDVEIRKQRLLRIDCNSAKLVSVFVRRLFYESDLTGVLFGFSCTREEYFERHMLRWSALPSQRHQNMKLLGTDPIRLIPGLYWLNFYSSAYLEGHGVTVEWLSTLGGVIKERKGGCCVQLYRAPGEWSLRRTEISAALKEHPAFFSMSRISIPNGPPREISAFVESLSVEFP